MKINCQTTTFSKKNQGGIDNFKGLLIIIVVMDHNDLMRALAPDLFKPLTFHVLGILALSFILPLKAASLQFFRDRLIRYFSPSGDRALRHI